MNKPKIIAFIVIGLAMLGCKTEEHPFPLDKRFWDTQDYKAVTLELNYGYENDEKLPSLDDPETKLIVEKLVDHQNYKVVLDDKELGLKHRNGVAEEFFKHWRDMQDIYQARDLQDNYLYDKELLKVWQFGLGLQLRYFKLGNDNIIASSDDPDSPRVVNRVNSNIETLIDNFSYYLDEINNESAFSEEGKRVLATGIDLYFTDLVERNANANFSSLLKKVELMSKKSSSPEIKDSLADLKQLINSKMQSENTED